MDTSQRNLQRDQTQNISPGDEDLGEGSSKGNASKIKEENVVKKEPVDQAKTSTVHRSTLSNQNPTESVGNVVETGSDSDSESDCDSSTADTEMKLEVDKIKEEKSSPASDNEPQDCNNSSDTSSESDQNQSQNTVDLTDDTSTEHASMNTDEESMDIRQNDGEDRGIRYECYLCRYSEPNEHSLMIHMQGHVRRHWIQYYEHTAYKEYALERQKKCMDLSGAHGALVLEYHRKTNKKLISVDKRLSKQLALHQKMGILFMYEFCGRLGYDQDEEKFDQFEKPYECVLTHQIGLGKSLQVIALVHTLLMHEEKTSVSNVVILCPSKKVSNWMKEFETWLPQCRKSINVYQLSGLEQQLDRDNQIRKWQDETGVLVLSYDEFTDRVNNQQTDQISNDLVIYDEFHAMDKFFTEDEWQGDCQTQIFLSNKPLHKSRRNKDKWILKILDKHLYTCNLLEMEHCSNYEWRDYPATEETSLIPQKHDIVIKVLPTTTQERLCNDLENSPMSSFTIEQLQDAILTHPRVSQYIDGENDWCDEHCSAEDLDDIRQSGKLMALFSMLDELKNSGDKMVVFSQDPYSLDAIEYFLAMIDETTRNGAYVDDELAGFTGKWKRNIDYIRVSESTTLDKFTAYSDTFNNVDSSRVRLFLASTQKGAFEMNLLAANHVVIWDSLNENSFNSRSIHRVFRMGQKKTCFIYRFFVTGLQEEEERYEKYVNGKVVQIKIISSKRIVSGIQDCINSIDPIIVAYLSDNLLR